MARYLATGGAGFIGSHLCDRLVQRGDDVVVVDDLSSGDRANLAASASRIDLRQGDVAGGALDEDLGAFDAIIHLAALISGHDSLHEPDTYIRANVNGLLRVIDYAARHKVPRIIFASSSTVYGANKAETLDENELPSPITTYAASKLMGEHLLATYGHLHGFTHCSLRLFNVFGPRQSKNHPYANVTCKFSYAAAHQEEILLYGDGEQTRDFVYVDDVVDALMLVMEASPSTVYNIGTGRETSINQLIGTLGTITGQELAIQRRPSWPNDVRRVAADLSRAQSELGYRARFSVEEGLARTVRAFLTN